MAGIDLCLCYSLSVVELTCQQSLWLLKSIILSQDILGLLKTLLGLALTVSSTQDNVCFQCIFNPKRQKDSDGGI